MKHILFPILILAVSLSLDALGAGLAYGMRKIKIPIFSKLIISFFSIGYSALALFAGKILAAILPPVLSKLIGVSLLLIMGIWILIQSSRKTETASSVGPVSPKESAVPYHGTTLFRFAIKSLGITIQIIRDPIEVDIDKSGIIDSQEALLLGLALSVDAIGAGIGSALAGFYGPFIPFLIGLFQIIFLYLGSLIGKTLVNSNLIHEKVLSFMPGILLILLALLRLK